MSADGQEIKAHAQVRFGQFADGYVTSASHASGSDLDLILELAGPAPGWMALDIATGGGHTALRLAPVVGHMVAADLTEGMLRAASKLITEKGSANVSYTQTDAENLGFASGVFDLVTCRIAPHHFPDAFRFVREVTRVLKPNGKFIMEDLVVPEEDNAARYLDAFERLRDPSHHWMYSELEWQGMFLDAGLTIEYCEIITRTGQLMPWAERQGCTPETIERLQVMLTRAPGAVAEWLQPQCPATREATFLHKDIILMGRKG